MVADTELSILDRVMQADDEKLSPDVSRSILKMTFGPADLERMNALASKTQELGLTPEEQTEAEAYGRVGQLLALLHSRARLALKQSGESS